MFLSSYGLRAQHLRVAPFQRLMEKYCVAKLRKDLRLPDPSPYLQINVGTSASRELLFTHGLLATESALPERV